MVVLVKENFKTALDYCHREYGHLDYCNNNGKSWLRRPLIRDSDDKEHKLHKMSSNNCFCDLVWVGFLSLLVVSI